MDIIFATKNKGKLKEIQSVLEKCNINVLSMEDAGYNIDIVEDGKSFEENALIKARTIMKTTKNIVLSDDSGILIDFLDKKPGLHSARYLGKDTPYIEKNRKILEMMKSVPFEKRSARFICVIAAVFPDGREFLTKGVMEGYIGNDISGENGFGYDPIFYVPEYKMTNAQLSPDVKNKISHRGKALIAMKKKLEALNENSCI